MSVEALLFDLGGVVIEIDFGTGRDRGRRILCRAALVVANRRPRRSPRRRVERRHAFSSVRYADVLKSFRKVFQSFEGARAIAMPAVLVRSPADVAEALAAL